jgi:hypothetical protein
MCAEHSVPNEEMRASRLRKRKRGPKAWPGHTMRPATADSQYLSDICQYCPPAGCSSQKPPGIAHSPCVQMLFDDHFPFQRVHLAAVLSGSMHHAGIVCQNPFHPTSVLGVQCTSCILAVLVGHPGPLMSGSSSPFDVGCQAVGAVQMPAPLQRQPQDQKSAFTRNATDCPITLRPIRLNAQKDTHGRIAHPETRERPGASASRET